MLLRDNPLGITTNGGQDHGMRLREHDLFMKTLANENRYWAAKANSAEAEERKMALELAMVEETAKTKGIYFESAVQPNLI